MAGRLNPFRLSFDNIEKIIILDFFAALYFYTPVLTLYFQQRELNFLQINSLWGIIVFTMFLTEVPTGIIADKLGRRMAIIISLTFQLLGEVLFIFAENYAIFVLSSIIGGIGFSFASGCSEALVYDSLKERSKENEMQRVSGSREAARELARMLAPLVAAVIVTGLVLAEFILLIAMTASSVALALLVSFSLKEPNLPYAREEIHPMTLLQDGVKLLQQNGSLQRIILLSLFATPFVNYLLTFHQPYLLTWCRCFRSLVRIDFILGFNLGFRCRKICISG